MEKLVGSRGRLVHKILWGRELGRYLRSSEYSGTGISIPMTDLGSYQPILSLGQIASTRSFVLVVGNAPLEGGPHPQTEVGSILLGTRPLYAPLVSKHCELPTAKMASQFPCSSSPVCCCIVCHRKYRNIIPPCPPSLHILVWH